MSYDVVARVVLERDSHLDEGAALRASLLKLAEVFGGAAPYQVRYPFGEWLPEVELDDGLGVVVVLVIGRLPRMSEAGSGVRMVSPKSMPPSSSEKGMLKT